MSLLLQKISHIDVLAFKWCLTRKHSRKIARVSRWISRLGDGVYYLVLALMLIWLEPTNGNNFFSTALLAFAFELPLYLLLKNTIRRRRPNDAISDFVAYLVPSDKFSFPSGHTAAAFVIATILSYFYPQYSTYFFLFAIGVGSSRVLLGVHFPTDILAGMVLGISSASSALTLLGYF